MENKTFNNRLKGISSVILQVCLTLLMLVFLSGSFYSKMNHTESSILLDAEGDCGLLSDWVPLPNNGGLLPAGNYYLNGDVTLLSNISISSGVVNLDLKGNILWGALNSDQSIFTVTGGTLSIYDCDTSNKVHNYKIKEVSSDVTNDIYYNNAAYSNKLFQRYYDFNDIGDGVIMGGIITGGHKYSTKTDLKSNFNYPGGGSAILVGNAGGTVNMYGGTLSGNTTVTLSQWGGKRERGGTVGVIDGGTFNFYQGQIVGNSSRYNGAGIYLFGSSYMPARANIYGGIIEDNYAFDVAYNFQNTSSMYLGGAGVATDNVGNGASIVSLSGSPKIIRNQFYDHYTNSYIQTNLSYSTESVNSIKILDKLYTESEGIKTYANIGLFGGAGEQLTSNYTVSGNTHEDVNKIFFADNPTQAVAYNSVNGELKYVTADLKTLTYAANNGSNETSQISLVDKISVSDVMFDKIGHTFLHWNTNPDDTGVVYEPNELLTLSSDLTVYAIWTTSSYNIGYWMNGGAFESPVQTVYTYGDHFSLPTPTWPGKVFEGWYDNALLSGNEITEIVSTTHHNQVFYAKWSGVDLHTILSTSGNHGTIFPLGSIIYDGTVQQYEIIPFSGYKVSTFTVNGEDKKMDIVNHQYTVSGITSDTLIDVTFEKIALTDITVYANAGIEGSITPKGYTVVSSGSSMTYTVTPNLGYQIKDVIINGESIGAVSTVTLSNITSAQSIYAEFSLKNITLSSITFHLNGGVTTGSYVLPINYTEGIGLTLPNASKLQKGTDTFEGWFDNELLEGEPITFISNLDTGSKIYYVKWQMSPTTIHFDSNGGSMVESITDFAGNTVFEPTEPTKLGHIFSGWYSDSLLTTPYLFNEMPDADITIYAKWITIDYTISFNSLGGSIVSSVIESHGVSITEPLNPTKLGHTFVGWFSDQTLVNRYLFDTPVTADLTLYAKWQVNSYTISFMSLGGSEVDSITQPYGSTVTEPTNPTKLGYTFIGWFSEINLYTLYEFTTMPAEDITVYAKYSAIPYTLFFNSNLGSFIESITASIGTPLVEPVNPTRIGYSFDGWYRDEALSEPFTFTTMPAENFTLYAKWTVNHYTITFITNDGTAITDINLAYGSLITAPESPSKLGHTFMGWYLEETLTTAYIFGEMPAEDFSLYAKWGINQYQITLDTKGGNSIEPIIQNYGTSIVLPNNPTRNGYSFNGWSQVIPSEMPAYNLIINAFWLKDDVTKQGNLVSSTEGLLASIDDTLLGNKDIEVVLQIDQIESTNVPQATYDLVEMLLSKNDKYTIIDIKVIIKSFGYDDVLIHELTQNITITLSIPEADQGFRNYRIVRIHEGQSTMLEADYDKNNQTLSFETDCFSNYAIVYETNQGINLAWFWLLIIPVGYLLYRYKDDLTIWMKKRLNR